MIKADMGIGQILKLMVRPELEDGRLVQVLSGYRSEEIGMYAVYPKRSHLPPKVRALIDYLLENKKALGVTG